MYRFSTESVHLVGDEQGNRLLLIQFWANSFIQQSKVQMVVFEYIYVIHTSDTDSNVRVILIGRLTAGGWLTSNTLYTPNKQQHRARTQQDRL